jgi:hypothetical protein
MFVEISERRFACRWENNIKVELKKWVVRVRRGFIWLRIVSICRNRVMNFRVP